MLSPSRIIANNGKFLLLLLLLLGCRYISHYGVNALTFILKEVFSYLSTSISVSESEFEESVTNLRISAFSFNASLVVTSSSLRFLLAFQLYNCWVKIAVAFHRTVEPPISGQVGVCLFVHYSEIVFYWGGL